LALTTPGLSGGIRQPHFDASFLIGNYTPVDKLLFGESGTRILAT
jgi:hypothetical protein